MTVQNGGSYAAAKSNQSTALGMNSGSSGALTVTGPGASIFTGTGSFTATGRVTGVTWDGSVVLRSPAERDLMADDSTGRLGGHGTTTCRPAARSPYSPSRPPACRFTFLA